MTLENQVCTLEQAKKLKELGVAQRTIFYWHNDFPRPVFGEKIVTRRKVEPYDNIQACNDKINAYSAFTVAELGVMINWDLVSISPPYQNDKEWHLYTNEYDYGAATEAEARAAMLIHLLENNLITVEEINSRLK